MTFLELVNDVLIRLRENTVTTLAGADDYTQLVMSAVNDALRQVENAWDWSTLREEVTVTLVPDQISYSLTGTGMVSKVVDVWREGSYKSLEQLQGAAARRRRTDVGSPKGWYLNGVDGNMDAQIAFHPTPQEAEDIQVFLVKRSSVLSSDSDVLKVPYLPVVLLAHSYLVRERGEDQGQSTQEFMISAQRALSDSIALDAAQYPEETVWYGV